MIISRLRWSGLILDTACYAAFVVALIIGPRIIVSAWRRRKGRCVACGYSLAGRGSYLPAHIKRVGVPVFKDDTGRAGLDQKITLRVIEELFA
jgi:hypothetical protein